MNHYASEGWKDTPDNSQPFSFKICSILLIHSYASEGWKDTPDNSQAFSFKICAILLMHRYASEDGRIRQITFKNFHSKYVLYF